MSYPEDLIFFYNEGTAAYFIKEYSLESTNRRFYFGAKGFMSSFMCLYYKKGFYARETINEKILMLQAIYITDHNAELFLLEGNIKAALDLALVGDKMQLIDLTKFFPSFIWCSALYGIAFIFLMVEICFKAE